MVRVRMASLRGYVQGGKVPVFVVKDTQKPPKELLPNQIKPRYSYQYIAIRGPYLPQLFVARSILLVAGWTLVWAAMTDLRQRKIPNQLVLILGVLYFLYVLAAGRLGDALWHTGFALVVFAGMLWAYAQRLMGGGDVKLLAVAFLWTGPWLAVNFAVFMLIGVGIYMGSVKLGWASVDQSDRGTWMPLAPVVAGALIFTFASGNYAQILWNAAQ